MSIIIITGSREAKKSESKEILDFIKQTLDSLSLDNITFYIGDCKGVDSIVKDVFTNNIIFKAEWEKYGLKAGPIRNQLMVDTAIKNSKNVYCIAFPKSSSKGTFHTINYAERKGIKVYVKNI